MINQVKEELWELNDKETREAVLSARKGDGSESISLEAFQKESDLSF